MFPPQFCIDIKRFLPKTFHKQIFFVKINIMRLILFRIYKIQLLKAKESQALGADMQLEKGKHSVF